jgi:signal transduction histidine kinase
MERRCEGSSAARKAPAARVWNATLAWVRQSLMNLVANAIKLTDRGGVRLVARLVGDSHVRPRLRFEVIDTGIGLSRETQAGLFTPFTQADASMTRRFGDRGLGLAVAKRLATMLGGDLGVRSAPGQRLRARHRDRSARRDPPPRRPAHRPARGGGGPGATAKTQHALDDVRERVSRVAELCRRAQAPERAGMAP